MIDARRTDEDRVLSMLAEGGFDGIPSLSDLAQSGLRYDGAVPILVAALDVIQDWRVKESVVRCLSVPWAKSAAGRLGELLPQAANEGQPALAWAIGNALNVLATPKIAQVMVDLACDRSLGRAREMIVLALPKLNGVIDAESVLLSLASDPDVDGHVVDALARVGGEGSRPVFERAATDTRAWVRRAAARGLKKLGA